MKIPVIIGQKELIAHPNRNDVTNYCGNNIYRCDKDSISIEVVNKSNERNWYFNDHCFIEDDEKNIHLFGINNPYPDNGDALYLYHPYLSHFVKKQGRDVWEFVGFAIDETKGCEYVGAPFVIYVKEQSRYVMVFETMIAGRRELTLAYSNDLFDWEKSNHAILTNLGYTKRDPCIIKKDEKYLIYLCNPKQKGSTVTLAETYDFEKFDCFDCLYIEDGSDYGGIESPFMVEKDDGFYLFFTYAHRSYDETLVLWSKDYRKFDIKNCVTTLNAHAAELVTIDGVDFLSSCGPEDLQEMSRRGVTLSRLSWIECPNNEEEMF